MKKKSIIIISIAAFVVITGTLSSFLIVDYNRKLHEQYVSESLHNIESWEKQFLYNENRTHRVSLYHGLSNNRTEYANRDSYNDEIMCKFDTTITAMEEMFFNLYTDEIDEIENREIVEQTEDKITAYTEKIDNLNILKSIIETDGVFNSDLLRLNKLKENADGLINYYTDTNDWLERANVVNNRFCSAERSGKFDGFMDITALKTEYEESDFENTDVFSILEATRIDAVYWFIYWYDEKIEELSVYDVNETEEAGDPNDFEDDEAEAVNRYDYLINALIELNDLIELFDVECTLLFTPFGIDLYYKKLDIAVMGNLTALEKLGVEIINDLNYRKKATEKAVERYNELFDEWKDGHRDNEHLPTYEEILQEAIDIGKIEHEKILAAERAAAARRNQGSGGGSRGSSGGGGSGSRVWTFTCFTCGAQITRTGTENRCSHNCATNTWSFWYWNPPNGDFWAP